MDDFVGKLLGSLLEAVSDTSPETIDDIRNVLQAVEDVAADVLDTFQDLFELIDDDGDRAFYEGLVRLVRSSDLGKQFDDDTIRCMLQNVLPPPDTSITLPAKSRLAVEKNPPTNDRDPTVSSLPRLIISA